MVLQSERLQKASDGTAAKARECFQALELDKGPALALGHVGALGEAGGPMLAARPKEAALCRESRTTSQCPRSLPTWAWQRQSQKEWRSGLASSEAKSLT